MATPSAYYSQAKVKRILEIASGDSSDDTFLDELGSTADQHIDNILAIHDERIILTSGNILNDTIAAANFYVAYIYKLKRGDQETAKAFKVIFDDLLTSVKDKLAVDGQPYLVERFNSRFVTGADDVFALWE